MPIETRQCVCGRRYAILSRRLRGGELELSSLDRDDIDDLTCPKCGGDDYTRLVTSALGVELGGDAGATSRYPRFDAGLGCMVRSATHLRQLLTHEPLDREGTIGPRRKVPLIQTHGDTAVDDFWERQHAKNAEAEAARTAAMKRDREQNAEAYARVDRAIMDAFADLKAGRPNIFTHGKPA